MKFYKNIVIIKLMMLGYIFILICIVGTFLLTLGDDSISEIGEIFIYLAIAVLVSILGFFLARKSLFAKIVMDDSSIKIMYRDQLMKNVMWDDIEQIKAWYNIYLRYISLENQYKQIKVVFTVNPKLFNKILNNCKNLSALKLFNQVECTRRKHRVK